MMGGDDIEDWGDFNEINLSNKRYVSDETRETLSKALKGRVISEEHRRKISQSRKGSKASQETRDKLSKASKGRKLSLQHAKKISESLKKSKNRFNPWQKRQRHTKESLTQIFRENFGDKFDYSKVDWDGVGTSDWWKKKITIICDVHGEFEQIPMSHKIGKGCKRCSASNRNKNRT